MNNRIITTLAIAALLTSACPAVSSCMGAAGAPFCEDLEMPNVSSSDIIREYTGFRVCYNPDYRIPNWVAYELTDEETRGELDRSGQFRMDMDYKGTQAMREDYSNSGWDKGHMAPAADFRWDQNAMFDTFFLTNICPQNHDLNGNDWNTLEKLCRTLARKHGSLWIVTGPIVNERKYGTIGDRRVVVPDAFFKALLVWDGAEYHSIGFIMENSGKKQPVRKSFRTVDELEKITGIDFFPALPDDVENAVETQADIDFWTK